MSASIHTLLADELGISDAKAKKLLSAMLREVRKRAKSGGVRLPNLGKFKEKDGQLVFLPEDSLVRAVNHRFEGLSSEDLGSAPMDEEEDDTSEEPSTITLGYQDSSNWSPLESEADEASAPDDDASDDAPDTAEFQVPDAEATEPPSTSESASTSTPDAPPETPPESAPDAEASPDDGDRSAPSEEGAKETEKLYPLVEDVPTGAEENDEPDDSSPEPASPASESPSADTPSPPEPLAPEDDPTAAPDDPTDDPISESPSSASPASPESDEPAPPEPDTSPPPEPDDPAPATASAEEDEDDFFGPSDDEAHDTLSGIWDSVDEEVEEADRDIPSPEEPSAADTDYADADEAPDGSMPDLSELGSSGTEGTEEPDGAAEPEADASPEPAETAAATEDPSTSSPEATSSPSKSAPDRPPEAPDAPDDASGSSIPRIIVSILVILMLGGGAWYILGQRGLVQSPSATYAQLRAGLQSSAAGSNNSTSSVPEFDPDSSAESTEEASDTPSQAASASASDEAPTTAEGTSSEQEAPSSSDPAPTESESSTDEASPETATASASDTPPQLDPAAGGWSIIVASRTNRAAAQELINTFRDRFDQSLPMGIIEATVDNSTRYRVGVGQFSSRSDAEAFLTKHSDTLPNGAWPVGL